MEDPAPSAGISCSFCGKHQKEVKKVIAGPQVYICDECVGLCNDIIAEDVQKSPPAQAAAGPPDPAALFGALHEAVVGQNDAKRAIVAALRHRHFSAAAQADLTAHSQPRRAARILLVGPSGVGKSTLGRAACEVAPAPAYAYDVGRVSEAGYVGDDVEHAVQGLLAIADGDVPSTERGFLFLDGVEKLRAAMPRTVVHRDISGASVQREMLRLLEGAVMGVPPKGTRHPQGQLLQIDTSRIVIVAAVRLEDVDAPPGPTERQLRDALVQMGLLGAFVSRFDRVVFLKPLAPSELSQIAERTLARATTEAQAVGARIEIAPDAIDALVASAVASNEEGFGVARFAQRLLEEIYVAEDPARTYTVTAGVVRGLLER